MSKCICVALAWLSVLAINGFIAPRAARADGNDTAAAEAVAGDKPVAKSAEAVEQRIARLVEELGSPEYLARRRAEKALEELGAEAFDALKAAEQHPDIEIATAARYLAGRIQVKWVREGDADEVRAVLRDYGQLAEDERRQRIVQLAQLSKDRGLPALCRIVRLESSGRLSKEAALVMLGLLAEDEAENAEKRAADISAALGNSRRPAADWLRTELQIAHNEAEAFRQWSRHTATERALLKANSTETSRGIFSALLRHQAAQLRKAGKREEAHQLLAELIDFADAQPASLVQLVDWLTEDQAWDLIDRVAEKFQAQFEAEPLLLYTLAEVKLKQGRDEQAESYAARAQKLAGANATKHLQLAIRLQERGLTRWAEREYREVISNQKMTERVHIFAVYRLSEMLHDQLREKEAGEVLTSITGSLAANAALREAVSDLGLEPDALQSRSEYFFACDAELRKDFAAQRKHLETAIGHDASDADVLIAMYRLPNADEAFQKRTKELIQKAAEEFREDIAEDPEDPQGYNQFAWLISNTEGDYEEAVRLSHHSLVLAPKRAGYLDTLGRCYYAKGDLDNAIKYQSEAVALEPHAQVIRRQLEFFKREQAARKNKQPTSSDGAAEPSAAQEE